MSFTKFKEELKRREGTGYHVTHKFDEKPAIQFAARGLHVNDAYLAFLEEVGYGSFFARSLVIFPLEEGEGSVLATLSHVRSLGIDGRVPVGYDGTTEGYYAVSTDANDARVYWVNIGTGTESVEHQSFADWIEAQPAALFSARVFKGYKKVRNPAAVDEVIRERRKFGVKVKMYDKHMVDLPGEKGVLPRFNRVVLSITKEEESPLKLLTVIIHRTGTDVGEDNKEYVTLDVFAQKAGTTVDYECYAFDPFNLPFETIVVLHDPQINLGTPMRSMFKEISEFL